MIFFHELSELDYYLTIELKGNFVDRASELNVGSLTFIKGKKTYVLDHNSESAEYNEHQDRTIIKCTFPSEHYDVLEDGTKYNEEFPDCKFDLPVEDMLDDSYKVLWIDEGLDEAEIVNMTFHAIYRDEEGVMRSSMSANVIEWSEYGKHVNAKPEPPAPDYMEYNGKKYRIRTLTMIEKGWGRVTRTIAGEDLYDAITKDGTDDAYIDDDTSEEYGIDNAIYHYIETEDLDKSGEYICKNCLDMEFEFVEEE